MMTVAFIDYLTAILKKASSENFVIIESYKMAHAQYLLSMLEGNKNQQQKSELDDILKNFAELIQQGKTLLFILNLVNVNDEGRQKNEHYVLFAVYRNHMLPNYLSIVSMCSVREYSPQMSVNHVEVVTKIFARSLPEFHQQHHFKKVKVQRLNNCGFNCLWNMWHIMKHDGLQHEIPDLPMQFRRYLREFFIKKCQVPNFTEFLKKSMELPIEIHDIPGSNGK